MTRAAHVFRIHPAINFARLGTSKEFYLSPDTSAGMPDGANNVGGLPIRAGTESETITSADWRDAEGQLKRQAARFRIFAYPNVERESYPNGGGEEVRIGSVVGKKTLDVPVVVIEAGDYRAERIGESVPPEIALLLQRLGVAERFFAAGHDACPGSASVWGDARVGHNDFIMNPLGHAWHLDRRRFDRMLAQRARELGAAVWLQTRFLGAARTDGGFVLELAASGRTTRLHTTWVVDATGPRAQFARSMGLRQVVDDRFFAIARFASLREGDMSRLTMLEAVPDGWWYAARLPGRRVVTMFAAERASIASLRAAPETWSQRLAETTLVGPSLAACTLADETFIVRPVWSAALERSEGPGWLAVGDAASCFDPLSAQGVHKALEDGIDAGLRLVAACGARELLPRGSRTALVRRRYSEYLANRDWLYARETRWHDAPFWHRRAAATERRHAAALAQQETSSRG